MSKKMKILLGLIILFLGYYLLNSTRSNESGHAIENNDSITIEKKTFHTIKT